MLLCLVYTCSEPRSKSPTLSERFPSYPRRRANTLSSPYSTSRSPYTLPSSVSRKSCICHSSENCRGVGVFFPFWKSLRGRADENSHFVQVLSFHILAHSFAHCKIQLFSFQAIAHSLSKNTRGGGTSLLSNHPHLVFWKAKNDR